MHKIVRLESNRMNGMRSEISTINPSIVFLMAILAALTQLIQATNDYFTNRNLILQMEQMQSLGGSLTLNEKEQLANKILIKSKITHYNHFDRITPRHFLQIRDAVTTSDLFQIIKKIPKGANLHGHFYGLASNDYIHNLTLRDDLHVCDSNGKLAFNLKPDGSCDWKSVEEMRETNNTFDRYVKAELTMKNCNYKNKAAIWDKFTSILEIVRNLTATKSAFKDHLRQILKEHYDDNVMYLEIRSSLTLRDVNENKVYGPKDVLGLCSEVVRNFAKNNRGFFGAKFIYSPYLSDYDASTYLENVAQIVSEYPDMVAGFDFPGDADYGLLDALRNLTTEETQLYHHVGIKSGDEFDLNLADAILLDSARVQYTDDLMRHPQLLIRIRNVGAGVDLCPISLQILNLENLQAHPSKYLIARGYHVTACNDYPGFWGARGLSHDWYVMFVQVVGGNADLRFLKQLAINSLVESGMSDVDKNVAIDEWQSYWDAFIDEMLLN